VNAGLLPDKTLTELSKIGDEPARAAVDQILKGLGYSDPERLPADVRSKEFPTLVAQISTAGDGEVGKFVSGGSEVDGKIDADLVQRAQSFFEDNGISIITALFHAALPEAYLGRRGVQVLGMTGELVTNWMRRIQLTGQLLITVLTPDPDVDDDKTTLHAGEVAAKAVRRVRLRHAAVRWLLNAPFDPSLPPLTPGGSISAPTAWQMRMQLIGEAPDSQPLNQEDLLGTLGTFTTVTFDALAKLAVPFDDDDIEAYYHLWNVVGWHLGIGNEASLRKLDTGAGKGRWKDNEIFPLAPGDLDAVFGRLRQRLQGPSDEGLRLTKTLLQEMSRPLPGPLQGAPAFLVRYLIGDELANDLEIDKGGYWQLLIRRTGALECMAKRLRVNALGELTVSALSNTITRYALRTFVVETSGGDPGFSLDPAVANRWGVQVGPEPTLPPGS
jgi:ER-bound oxygenase mpaB/B'/Rubber oxygenase, catalytic domain